MDFGLSDEERARLGDLSRRRSARLLLVALALVAAVELVLVVLGTFLGSTDELGEVAVSLLPFAVVALIGLALHLRNQTRPLLLLGAEPDIQRRVTQAVRDGRASDTYIDALATDLAARQAKQPWSPVVTGAIALGLVLSVIGAESFLLAAVRLYLAAFFAFATLIWWRNIRRARRYLANRSGSAG